MIDNLNKSQYEAVTSTEGPVLIIAGPGSGKTKTLVERTVYILSKKNVKPENIFLSTFTEKAASELISRISEKLKENNLNINLSEMYIGTLHSIFRRIIEENIESSTFYDNFKVLDDTEQLFFIYTKISYFKKLSGYNDFFKNIPCRNTWEKSKKILQWLDTLNEYGKNLKDIKTQNPSILFLKEAQQVYKNLLVDNNVIDFSTIQAELLEILVNNKNILDELNEKFRYIMIDEYQDTNNIQEKIIFLLGYKYKNICVVGDDDQAIYRFRGATTKNILKFPKRFDDNKCKHITLDTNYRSQLDIVRLCNTWISMLHWNGYRYEKTMYSTENKSISPTASVIRIGGENESSWKENLYKFIKTLYTTKKITDYSQVAFLFKSVQIQQVKELKKYFEERQIPVYSPRSKDFFEKEEIIITIASLLVYFPQTKYLVFDKVKNRTNEVFFYYQFCLENLKKIIKKDEKFYQWIVEKRKENAKENIETFPNLKTIFYSFLQFDTFKKYLNLDNNLEHEKRETHNLAIFTDILDKYESLTKISQISSENINTYLKYFFMNYIRQLREKRVDEFENKDNFPTGAIPFLTFHQSKGLEFPVVIVDSLYSIPQPQIKTYEDELKNLLNLNDNFEPHDKKPYFDLWRLYYTAFSRAQDLLVLTSIENKNGHKRLPSQTFAPLFYRAPDWQDSKNFELKYLNISPTKESNIKKYLSYSSNITLYEFCPLKYQFIKEFDFKQNKNTDTLYGIFFHKVIEKIHKYIIKHKEIPNELKIKNIVDKIVKTMHTTYQIEFEESSICKIYNSINKYLNFINPSEILASEFKVYSIEDGYILEGIFDLIRKKDNSYELIDFKSGKYSEYFIQSYKKQLALYSYLIKNEYNLPNIKTYLYFEEEENPFFEVKITEKDIENEITNFNLTADKLLNNNFPPKPFDEKCNKCDFRWFCNSRKGEM